MKLLHLFLFLLLCSCEQTVRLGGCDVNLSKKELFFSAEGGIDSVTASFLNLDHGITIGDTIIYYHPPPPRYKLKENVNKPSEPFFAYDAISYITIDPYDYVIHIESSWFTIDRLDREKIMFSVSKNETGKERNFGIYLNGGNCIDALEASQSAK